MRAGTEVAGEWTQRGKRLPADLQAVRSLEGRRAAPIPKELEGFWEGKLKVNAGIELRLVLKVQKGKDGALESDPRQPRPGREQHPDQRDRASRTTC